MRRAPRITPASGSHDGEHLRARARDFSAPAFWQKLARFARAAGRELVEKALWLYYAAERPDVPRWAKLTMWGALAYFVMPVDAIPDLLPGVGYVDDLGALAAALATVAGYVDEDVKARARERLSTWFGPSLN